MRKFLTLATVLVCLAATTTAFAKVSVAEQKQQIAALRDETLAKLYEKYPDTERVINNCYDYATLSNSGVKVIFFGSSHGRGLAYNHQTGEKSTCA